MSRLITTLVMYHPLRPVDCLIRTLESLAKATKHSHRVEVFVQGMCRHDLPPTDAYAPMELVYLQSKANVGNSRPMAERFRHWMNIEKDETEFWAKVDDDFELPERGWDLLIEALDAERSREQYSIGAACLGTKQNFPQMFHIKDGVFDRVFGFCAVRVERIKELEWVVADFVHNGATIYTREAFEAGCMFDPAYFVGGEHVDMALQMHQVGLHSIATSNPKSVHFASKCTPEEYRLVRMDQTSFVRAHDHFVRKWGLKNPKLAKSAGLLK